MEQYTNFSFVNEISNIASNQNNLEDLLKSKNSKGIEVNEILSNLILKIGENIIIKKFEKMITNNNSKIFGYIHNNYDKDIGKIGCLLHIESEKFDSELISISKNIFMHINIIFF